jgi:hypothetical protein
VADAGGAAPVGQLNQDPDGAGNRSRCNNQDLTRQPLHLGIVSSDKKRILEIPLQKVNFAIQEKESPGKDKEANWLPAPKGKFVLMLCLYWPVEPPQPSIINGTWEPPVVKSVH